jgi:hypothetical protein
MTTAQPITSSTAQPQVWLLMSGELHEGGRVDEVFLVYGDADMTLAMEHFRVLADRLADRPGRRASYRSDFHVEVGSDWASLTCHQATCLATE